MNTIKNRLLLLCLWVTSQLALGQNKPFPQALNFPNCIKPTNVTQTAMNSSVSSYYTYWKGKYLKNDLSSLPGGYYVKGEITGSPNGYTPLGSSEGQGYGMLITVMMAGFDANARTIFDGLFKTARAYKSSGNPNLMGWVVADAASAQGNFGSATDGDMDIAYALILAHYQWGSSGTINYLNEAKNMITNGIKASYVTNGNRLNLGDWDSKTTTNTRPSDWMMNHLKAFKDVTGDVTWDNVATTTYGLISGLQTNYSSTTGLMPDFATGNPVRPTAPNFLESEYDDDYYYNACRTPLRFVMDYAHYGNTNAKTAVHKIVTWAKTKTNNTPTNFRAGYTLAGTDLSGNNYQSAVFIAPIVAASTCDAAHQAYLNSGWSSIINMKAGYFEDTYNLLCMLYISGNWWIPLSTTGQSPTINITSPANNATFTAPASITINATAADADGTISKVEFYNGTNLLGSDNASPYSFSWTNVAAGTYSLTAKATDNAGNSTTSTAVTVIVSVPQSPYGGTRASIPGTIQAENYDLGGQNVAYNDVTTANEGGASYRAGDAVDIEAMTGGGYNVGYIVAGEWLKYMVNVTTAGNYKIEAYVAATAVGNSFTLDLDGTTIATVNVPNTGDWQTWQVVTINNVDLTTGNKVLRFNATTGDFNLDRIVFSLIPNISPTVSITSPANNAPFTAPASINVTANASDSDGSISKVEFYNGTNLLGSDNSSPYSYNWTGIAAGTYTITAKAYDNLNAVTTSSAITIVVSNPNVAPTVSITSPANNASYTAPASVTITASASDSDGSIAKVEFYNGANLLSTDNSSPYSYNWTGMAAGTYTITAKAYDNLNAVTTSSVITIIVSNPNAAPTVSITSPANNATFTAPASVNITANASDSDGSIAKVEFYNGANLLSTDNSSPYSYNWTGVGTGTYTITAKAYDNLNAVTTSSVITIIVSNPNGAPTVSITSPANNATFTAPASVTITANASDSDGSIAKVEFYNGANLLSTDNSSPYSYNWTGIAAGTYTITAKAYDNLNAVTTSSVITIIVSNPNVAPTVSITSPANNATYTAPASVTITASASDSDGSISKVEFYNGTNLLGSDNSSPYSYNWTGVVAGTYTITAKAYDNLNTVTTSSAITVVVNNANSTPVVTISSSITSTVEEGTEVVITATANDSDGSITKMEIFDGNVKIGELTSEPYIFTLTNLTVGEHSITVVATDNNGGQTISSVIEFTVTEKITGIKKSESSEIKLESFPNPFNYSTEIQLTLMRSGKVMITVYDNFGREVAILADEYLSTGTYNYKLDGINLIPGTYVCKVMNENQFKNIKIIKQ